MVHNAKDLQSIVRARRKMCTRHTKSKTRLRYTQRNDCPTCITSIKIEIKGKTQNTTLSEQFQNPKENSQKKEKSILALTQNFITARLPGLVQAHQ